MAMRFLLLLLLPIVLPACGVTPVKTESQLDLDLGGLNAPPPPPVLANAALFSPTAPAASPEALFPLSAEQADAFLDWFHAEERESVPEHRRLEDYLWNQLASFRYVSETLPPAEAIEQRAGNCMSLAALTHSLSQLAELEHDFQLVETPPAFEQANQTLISNNHVRSRIFRPRPDPDSSDSSFIIVRGHIEVDYFNDRPGVRGDRISDEAFLAMYYHNLGVESLLDGDLDQAFTLAQAALNKKSDYPDALNLLGILHRRANDPATAEAYFNYITEVHGLRPDVLSNLANLLRSQGRDKEADALKWQLADIDDSNPYHWVELGNQARRNGSPELALHWYRIAIQNAPYFHEAYWQAGVTLSQQDDPIRSGYYFERALELTNRRQTREQYLGKLGVLKAGTHSNIKPGLK